MLGNSARAGHWLGPVTRPGLLGLAQPVWTRPSSKKERREQTGLGSQAQSTQFVLDKGVFGKAHPYTLFFLFYLFLF
jgi:hypothetical protein